MPEVWQKPKHRTLRLQTNRSFRSRKRSNQAIRRFKEVDEEKIKLTSLDRIVIFEQINFFNMSIRCTTFHEFCKDPTYDEAKLMTCQVFEILNLVAGKLSQEQVDKCLHRLRGHNWNTDDDGFFRKCCIATRNTNSLTQLGDVVRRVNSYHAERILTHADTTMVLNAIGTSELGRLLADGHIQESFIQQSPIVHRTNEMQDRTREAMAE